MPRESPPPARRRRISLIVRDARAGFHVDVFLVCAVVTILVTRALLKLTGYPQLGGAGLHIAHVLWGGFGLASSLLLVLVSLSHRVRTVAAFLGGASVGLFLDELGKFVTSDNDYFYQPTIALLYCIFVVFFLVVRRSLQRNVLTTDENLANALAVLGEMALGDLDPAEKARATAFLDASDAGDPRVVTVRAFLEGLAPVAAPPRAWHHGLRGGFHARLERLVAHRRFPAVLSIVFVGQAVFAATWTVLTARLIWQGVHLPAGEAHLQHGFSEWAQVVSTAVSTILAVAGVSQLLTAPERAYRLFRLSLFVAIFLTQFFIFYRAQLSGVFGLALNLAALGAVQYLLDRERRHTGETQGRRRGRTKA